MKLVLHILLKDLRRQRLEIAGFSLAVAVWAFREVHPGAFGWLQQRDLIPIVMFGLWFLVTVRAVHGESLVGDREWWPTHPYRWGQLLAAKILLLVTLLNGPVLIAQLFLLMHAGIPLKWSLAPGLIYLHGMLFLFLTFPAAVLASVTASLVQWLMSIAGIALAAVVVSWLPWGMLPPTLGGQEDVASWTGFFVLFPLMAVVLIWQYARRREWPARIVLGCALAAIPLCILLASTSMTRRMAYANATASSARFAIKASETGVREFDWASSGEIRIPLIDPALGGDEVIQTHGYRLHLVGSGWQWESEWRNSTHTLSFIKPEFSVGESLPGWVQSRVEQGHATAQIEMAWETYRLYPAVSVQAAEGAYMVPGIGYCIGQSAADAKLFAIHAFGQCAAPLRLPPVYLITMDSIGDQCTSGSGAREVPAGYTAYSLNFGSSVPADFNTDPVRGFSLSAGDWVPPLPQKLGEYPFRNATVCPGASFTVRTGRSLGTQQKMFDLGDIGVAKIHSQNEPSDRNAARFSPTSE